MRLGRKPWTETRREAVTRDQEPADRPLSPAGRPYFEIRCHKCAALLAYVERMMPGDYVVLPPGEAPESQAGLTEPAAPDPRLTPPGAGVVVLWCQRCRERRFTHSPLGGRTNGGQVSP